MIKMEHLTIDNKIELSIAILNYLTSGNMSHNYLKVIDLVRSYKAYGFTIHVYNEMGYSYDNEIDKDLRISIFRSYIRHLKLKLIQ